MLIELKQNTFRFLILSHINELLINKELIVNSIKKATQNNKVPRTVSEVDSGYLPSTDPFFEKDINKILLDLQSFVVKEGDTKRRGASESTISSEVSISDDTPLIKIKSFILETAWGYLNTDTVGNDLTSGLEEAFSSFLGVCRSIGSWTIYLSKNKNNRTIKLGASALAELSTKWGPVDLTDDLDDFYNKLFGPLYHFALSGKVEAVLKAIPIGIAIQQIYKKGLKFGEDGFLDMPLPKNDKKSTLPSYKSYITDIDYLIAKDSCGIPEVTVENTFDPCDEIISLQLKEYEGIPICKKTKRIPRVITPLPTIDPPPPIIPPTTPPIITIPPTTRAKLAIMFVVDCSTAGDDIFLGANIAIEQFMASLGNDDAIGIVSFENSPRVIKTLTTNKIMPEAVCTHC